MLRASAVSKLEIFLVKLSLGSFLVGRNARTGLANTLSGTAAMAAPDTTRSASDAILHSLLTRDLAPAGSSLPKPDCKACSAYPAEVMSQSPSESQGSHFFHPFLPHTPTSLLSSNSLGCDSNSNPREKEHLYYYAFPLHALNSFPNSRVVTVLSVYAL